MSILWNVVVLLVMLGCMIVIPFGLPGLWLMIVVVMGLMLLGQVSLTFALVAAGAAGLAELAEFLVLKRFGDRFGGSRKAFWGAIAGGMAGLFVGLPIPIVGPLITVFLGTFLGAGLVTFVETRSLARSTHVGWGLVLARTAAVGLKLATAVGVAAATAFVLI